MKKTLVSALTTALVVGAASTTFAAANPFSDVPADHWAYDAVSQLAADGVIEGYGDSTFRGDRSITRYEMAQMVARAMAKNDVSAATKAMIDKLAAEFADELNSLGVRVANLERNADMVKWNGKLEYTYLNDKSKRNGVVTRREKSDKVLFRLEPSAEVNDHWHVNARLDASYDMNRDAGNVDNTPFGRADSSNTNVSLKRAWAQGDYKMFSVRFGKFAMYGNDSINDATMSGLDVTIGNENKVSGAIGLGRTSDTDFGTTGGSDAEAVFFDRQGNRIGGNPDPFDVFYAGVDYNKAQNKGFFGALRYFRYGSNDDFAFGNGTLRNDMNDKDNIWQIKAGYKFDRSSTLQGYYAHGDVDDALSSQKKSYNIEFDYKGAQPANKGTWGAWLAYRHLGQWATPAKTWDVIAQNEKGWAIGVNYTFLKNIVGTVQYGWTKTIDNINPSEKNKHLFGRLEWLF